jgi:putative pyruvate formate lyase activating enzyme
MPGHALSNYYRILDEEQKARYLSTNDRMIEADLTDDDQTLWRIHDSALRSKKITRGNIPLLDLKCELANRLLRHCTLCEHRCGSDRTAGNKGHCGVLEPRISSEFIHMGEEPDLVPSYTIFFAGCTFNCVFCQNWDISTRPASGVQMDAATVARMIEDKTERAPPGRFGSATSRIARNVNWVGGDPTANLPFILDVLEECHANIPQVWNSNMYLSEEAMRLLDGVIDVYLTDFKYGNDECALRLSNASDYMRIVGRNHKLARAQAEMIIRHLVLPGHVECCTRPVLNWIAENLSDVVVNIMSQYRPEYRATEFPEISRYLDSTDYKKAIAIAERLDLMLCR